MKTVKFLKLAGVLGFGLMLAQGVAAQTGSSTPPDFPVYPKTGDEEADAAAWELMKQEYYSIHPELLEGYIAPPALSPDEQNALYEAEKVAAAKAAELEAAREAYNAEVAAMRAAKIEDIRIQAELEGLESEERLSSEEILHLMLRDGREVIPYSDYQSADAAKRAYIDSHPDLFIVLPKDM